MSGESECVECGATGELDEHHTSYNPEETVMFCRSCHQQVHRSGPHPLKPDDERPNTTIEITESQKKSLDGLKRDDRESYKSVLDRLLDGHDGDGPSTELGVDVKPTVDEDALADLKEQVSDAVGDGADAEAIAREVARQLDYAALAGKVADEVVGELR